MSNSGRRPYFRFRPVAAISELAKDAGQLLEYELKLTTNQEIAK